MMVLSWKPDEKFTETMMKIRKKSLIRYLHGARVTEGGIIHTKRDVIEGKRHWSSQDDGKHRWGQKKEEKNEIKFKTLNLHEN